MKSVEACIEGYLEQVEKRKNVDYADKASVRKFNAAYDKCFKYAKYIDEHYPEQLDLLVALLEHPDTDVVRHCAPMLFRLNNTTKEHKQKAIEASKKLIQHPQVDDVNKFAIAHNVAKWEEELYDQSTSDKSVD